MPLTPSFQSFQNQKQNQMQDLSSPKDWDHLSYQKQPDPVISKELREKVEINADILFISDSSGKHVDLNRLYPIEGATSKNFYCPLSRDLNNLVEEAEFINPPKVVIVHCGTNDLDHTDSITLVNNIAHSIQKLSSKLVSSKIIASGLLPRRDYTNKDIYNINLELSKKFQLAPNVHFVEHKNLLIDDLSSILHDKKRLNESGIKT